MFRVLTEGLLTIDNIELNHRPHLSTAAQSSVLSLLVSSAD